MTTGGYQRARSAEAKQQREAAILDAAARLGSARGIRQVTLTDIADAVGMHKSAMPRHGDAASLRDAGTGLRR